MTFVLHHCPTVLTVVTISDPLYQGACTCCGWVADHTESEPQAALSNAFDHLASCDESWGD